MPATKGVALKMGLFLSLLTGERLLAVALLFLLFSGISLYFFSAGQPRSLLRGLFMTLVDLFVAPFAYIRYAVFRLVTEGGQSVHLKETDPQFLMRTAIRIQLAVLFVALSLIGSAGLMMVLDQSVPPEVSESRLVAAERLDRLRSEELPAALREIEDLESKLKDTRVQEEMSKKRAEVAELTAKIGNSHASLSSIDSGGYYSNIHRFLEGNSGRLRTPGGRREIRDAVSGYLRQSPTQAEFDDMVFKHLELMFQKAVLEQEISEMESANSPEMLRKEKSEAERRVREIQVQMKALEKDSSLLRLLTSVSMTRISWGLIVLFAVVWGVLWAGGVTIESAEIFIEMATNLRRIRRISEGRPGGTAIVPVDTGTSA